MRRTAAGPLVNSLEVEPGSGTLLITTNRGFFRIAPGKDPERVRGTASAGGGSAPVGGFLEILPVEPSFTRSFKRDKELLQREQKSGVSPLLSVGAYLVVLLIFLGLYGSMGWGLALMQQRLGTRAVRA